MQLANGISIAEVARGLEVNPNVLHRWRRGFRQGPGNAFPGNGKQRWSEGRLRNWSGRWASKRWRSIF
jgi:transposase-like protein